jgi:hypothetical protein
MSDELEMGFKEAAMAQSMYYRGICLEDWENLRRTSSRDYRLEWVHQSQPVRLSMMRNTGNIYRILALRPLEKSPLGRSQKGWQNKLKTYLWEVPWKDMRWMQLLNIVSNDVFFFFLLAVKFRLVSSQCSLRRCIFYVPVQNIKLFLLRDG